MQLTLPVIEDIDDIKVEYNHIHRSKSTFQSGVSKAIHGWFRLTPSFGPDLVQIVLDEFSYSKSSVVLDPYAGVSTTLIECQLQNLKSYGFEINPMLYFAGKTSLNWSLSPTSLKHLKGELLTAYVSNRRLFRSTKIEALPCSIPPIHNVYRWWREDVLRDLLILKHTILSVTDGYGEDYRDFCFLCLAGVLVPDLTNVTLGKLQLHFIDRSEDTIDVQKSFIDHFSKMISDFEFATNLKIGNQAQLLLTDSTVLDGVSIEDEIDIVITSPPYPNRYSYVWNTRPFLYFFDFFTTPKEASALDLKTIGGTWGVATSVLAKGIIEPTNAVVERHVKPVTEQIRQSDNLMANYVMKYFNMLTEQVIRMDSLLSKQAKVAYVVGNSEIKGVFVETDILLAKIFRDLSLDYNSIRINRFRKRNSGKNLFESTVYAEK